MTSKQWFAWLCQKYVQRADARQKALDLQYTEAETHDLALEIARASATERKKAKLWDDLMHLCGTFHDSSSTVVTFSDDDATRTYHIKVGKEQFYGRSFEGAMVEAMTKNPREEEL